MQTENKFLKEQLKKANITFPENNVFEDKIEDTSEYDPDQGARIASRFITEEMAKQFVAMFCGRTDVYAKRGRNGGWIGVYPLRPDGICRFLVFDFDKFKKVSI